MDLNHLKQNTEISFIIQFYCLLYVSLMRRGRDSNPWNAHHARLFSRQMQSTTLPPLHYFNLKYVKDLLKILCKYTNNFWYFQIFFQLFLNSWYICFYLKQRCKYTYFFWKNQILIWYFLHFIVFITYLSLVKRYFSRGSDWEQGISLPPTGPWFSRDVRWDIPHFFCSD